jgi:hypothetical protein
LSRLGGGGGTGPRLGGGGGTDDLRSPGNGGGTRKPAGGPSSSRGVLGGRGGGGGPGLARVPEEALARLAGGEILDTANFPASAKGGGALNLGCGVEGGDGEGGGDSALGGDGGLPPTGLRDGGGAGGGPLLPEVVLDMVVPVLCGLNFGRDAAAAGGSGGGAFDLPVLPIASAIPCAVSAACFSLTYCLMKSASWAI